MATSRTADPREKALKSARTKADTAARKSLDLIAEAVSKHQAALAGNEVPAASDSFTASVLKYEGTLAELRVLGKLMTGSTETENGIADPVEVSTADLNAMVTYLVAEVTGQGGVIQPGTPLDNLAKAVMPDGPGPAVAPAPAEAGAAS